MVLMLRPAQSTSSICRSHRAGDREYLCAVFCLELSTRGVTAELIGQFATRFTGQGICIFM